jgi:hypothetical protein
MTLLFKQSRNGHSIAAIISLARENHKSGCVDMRLDELEAGECRPFHQRYGRNGLMFDRIPVPVSDLFGREYFHAYIKISIQSSFGMPS